MQERRRGVNPLPVDDNVAKARMFHLAQGVLVGLASRPAFSLGSAENVDEFAQNLFGRPSAQPYDHVVELGKHLRAISLAPMTTTASTR